MKKCKYFALVIALTMSLTCCAGGGLASSQSSAAGSQSETTMTSQPASTSEVSSEAEAVSTSEASSEAGAASTSESSSETEEATASGNTSSQASSSGDSSEITQASQEIFAMDTYMTVTAYGSRAQDAVDAAIEEIERLDDLLSTGIEDSEIAKVNANGGGTLSEDASYLLGRALELYDSTDGVFDVAIYPIMEEWGFTTQEYKVPDEDTLKSLLKIADPSLIEFDQSSGEVSFKEEGVKIDLGGIAKGYTSSRIMDIFEEYEIESGLVNLGGNVQLYGKKIDGSDWRVGIKNPDDPENQSSMLGIISTSDKAVITSGGYERYFEEDGVTYHHIIDPSTGYPAENGLTSVTIVSSDGTLADGLSTSLFIMGEDKAAAYWKSHSDEFEVIMLTDEGTVYVSEGLADCFTTDFPMEIISK